MGYRPTRGVQQNNRNGSLIASLGNDLTTFFFFNPLPGFEAGQNETGQIFFFFLRGRGYGGRG